jgi:hypothetical protein
MERFLNLKTKKPHRPVKVNKLLSTINTKEIILAHQVRLLKTEMKRTPQQPKKLWGGDTLYYTEGSSDKNKH